MTSALKVNANVEVGTSSGNFSKGKQSTPVKTSKNPIDEAISISSNSPKSLPKSTGILTRRQKAQAENDYPVPRIQTLQIPLLTDENSDNNDCIKNQDGKTKPRTSSNKPEFGVQQRIDSTQIIRKGLARKSAGSFVGQKRNEETTLEDFISKRIKSYTSSDISRQK